MQNSKLEDTNTLLESFMETSYDQPPQTATETETSAKESSVENSNRIQYESEYAGSVFEPRKSSAIYNSLPAENFFKQRRYSKKGSHYDFDAYMLVSLVKKKNESFRFELDDANKSLTLAQNKQLIAAKGVENDFISETLAKRAQSTVK